MSSKTVRGSRERVQEFQELVRPLVNWLMENYDPHASITIDVFGARLQQEQMGVPNKKEGDK